MIGNDDIRPSRVEIGSPEKSEKEIDSDEQIEDSEDSYDSEDTPDHSTRESKQGGDSREDGERDTGESDGREIVTIETHPELIG